MTTTFGVEAIRHFANARASGPDSKAADLTYTFNRSNGFDRELRNAHHARAFYWTERDVFENDLHDSSLGGDDANWVDNVDLFWIETHGNNVNGVPIMLYDNPVDDWLTWGNTWELGEAWNAEWMMAYSCHTVDRNNVTALWPIFKGLHLYCGAWENMYDGITTDECGEDVADNLTDGDTVASAWIDGVSDWSVDNHPIVVGPATAAAWNGGNIRWNLAPHNTDHIWGEGSTAPDLAPAQQGCLLWRWAEG
ncbi:DUF6345 domain-containing protein [Micromonospora sp. DT81.3]|uniref:DUF6345 domain-containing protein n=1 Tax=Micromonospora sp. DT81.3 TaxID=3416523 RepID=UPI003CEFA57B